jgi:hypothetical protein
MDVAKKAAVSTDEVVKQALLTIAGSETPLRLAGKGEHPPVFAKVNKEAVAALTDANKPLVVETGSGKAAKVSITPAGFSFIADAIPEEKVGAAARAIAEALPPEEQIAFIQDVLPKVPHAAAGLEPMLAEAVRKQTAEAEARVAAEKKRAESAEVARAAVQRCLDHLAKLQSGRIEELTGLLIAAGGTVPTRNEKSEKVSQGEKPKPVEPSTKEDRIFQRDVAERLVSSWRDAVNLKKAEAQGFIETALDNISGLRRIGEEGESVAFDGALHESIPGVFTDHPVKVTRSGWALEEDDDREYVIQKAQVAK